VALNALLTVVLCALGCAGTRAAADGEAYPATIEGALRDSVSTGDSAVTEALRALHNTSESAYRLGPGDQFDVFVYGEDDITTLGAVVKPDGAASVKLAGEIPVLGKTVDEVVRAIEERLREYLKYPKVSLLPKELRGATFTVIGKVNSPGVYPVAHNMRLLDAIAVAGGLTTGIFDNNTVEMADLEHSYICRDGRILPVNFGEAIHRGNALHNVPLRHGDYIYVPSSMNREVYVIGEVLAPGYFGYRENLTLAQLIARAQGPKPTASRQVVVVRGSLRNPAVYSHDLSGILSGRSRDVKLEPDDIVFVPRHALAKWNAVLQQLLPSLEAVQRGAVVGALLK